MSRLDEDGVNYPICWRWNETVNADNLAGDLMMFVNRIIRKEIILTCVRR